MKTHIYYFSGTGNSLNVARLLAAELGDSEVRSIPDAMNREIDASFDRLGIVFPVYGWGLPLIVRDFLKKIRTDKYVFAVATYGGRPAGTIRLAKQALNDNNTVLNCGMGVKMPDNCIIASGAQPAEKQGQILREAGARVKKIADIIKDGRTRCVEEGSFLENWLLSGIMYGKAEKKFRTNDRSFMVDDRCKSCGTCARMCPVNNIEMASGQPRWQGRCEQCLTCLQWCPNEAIQIGNKTQLRIRYRNPNVTQKDLTYRH